MAVWLDALTKCGLPVRVETCSPPQTDAQAIIEVQQLTPRWLKWPSIARYLWAGLAARLKRRGPNEIIHAHCTSGYGMVAWMSGHPYIVTTYGSEVLAGDERSWPYRWLIHRVLKGADRITATSPQMVDVLTEDHGIPRERIHLFDLGLNTQLFRPLTNDDRLSCRRNLGIGDDEPVWISVKRVLPMNRTMEIVKAFEAYCDDHPEGRLIVICGDDVSEYSSLVKQAAAGSHHASRITVLTEWMQPAAVARWLQIADFAISVPTSDQMSNAVLEAMACGCVPMLLDIDGYRSLRERDATVHWLEECTVESLKTALKQTAGMSATEMIRQKKAGVSFIDAYYSDREGVECPQSPLRPSKKSRASCTSCGMNV